MTGIYPTEEHSAGLPGRREPAGIAAIATAFRRMTAGRQTALMPFYPLGYPNPDLSLAVIEAMARSGADLLELGIPFSDPLADGPTIQGASQAALKAGMTVQGCLDLTARARDRGVDQPVLLMSYLNPLLAFGIDRFVRAADRVGTDGLIVPDLPLEEAGQLQSACRSAGMALVFLVAPNATAGRIEQLARQTSGFLYLVSLTGVTGTRERLPEGLDAFIRRVRQHARTPLAVGFGISSPAQAAAVGALADGVIVGSAVIHAVQGALASGGDPAAASGGFIQNLKSALVQGQASEGQGMYSSGIFKAR